MQCDRTSMLDRILVVRTAISASNRPDKPAPVTSYVAPDRFDHIRQSPRNHPRMTHRKLRAVVATAAFTFLVLVSSALRAQSPVRPRSIVERIDASFFAHSDAVSPISRATRQILIDSASLMMLSASTQLAVGDFPIGGSTNGTIELRRIRSVVDGRTRVRVGTSSGEVDGALPATATFRGTVRGEAGSRVFLVMVGGTLFGSIDRASGERFVIGPSTEPSTRDAATSAMSSGMHVIASESSFPQAVRDIASTCLAEGSAGYRSGGFQSHNKPTTAPAMLDAKLLEFTVAVEADQEFYRRTGATVEKATGYIIALWSMVSALFEDEINVTFRLPWIKVWSSPDPYLVAGNGYDLWGKAPAYWRANYADVERDLAHIFTASDWGGGGIAFRGEGADGNPAGIALCSKEYGYAMSSPRAVLTYPTFAFTYDAYIVAHETGHNFGSRHTHECWWNPAIDTCLTRDSQTHGMADACHASPIVPRPSPGSIMSYCMGINQETGGGSFEAWSVRMKFTQRVAAVMRQEAELAPCKREPAEATIILTSPRGDVPRIAPDTAIDIRWSSSGVATVGISYSIDDRRTWRTIAAKPAVDGAMRWLVPQLCTESFWIRIADASDQSIADTSLLPVTVLGAAIDIPPVFRRGDTLITDAGTSYQWMLDGQPIVGATQRTHFARRSGIYVVEVVNENGCSSTSNPIAVTVAGLDGDTREASVLRIEAIAVREGECCAVRFHLPASSVARVSIIDNVGRRVAVVGGEWNTMGWHEARLDGAAMAAGSYWVVVRAGERVAVQPFVVK